METALKTGFLQHTLDIANLYLRNCALKHGVAPIPAGVVLSNINSDENRSAPSSSAQSAQQTSPASLSAAATASPLTSALKTAGLVGLSMLAGGGTVGAVLGPYLASKATTIVEPAAPNVDSVLPFDKGSPLQWLEDQGMNVPPDSPAEKPRAK